eukprot:CAMPEP_0168625976 /NCGR_PEP_ID=MMETSP0449_2-20121227/10352_1 /TAXON_ID=1082188 /ORGANISM="Strombidium rassoulzadegani, Strain ras09" /LENGTH=33 /DNA_ID= /DNA_START= /DNA_END= /DNA_ORIENTATION=
MESTLQFCTAIENNGQYNDEVMGGFGVRGGGHS